MPVQLTRQHLLKTGISTSSLTDPTDGLLTNHKFAVMGTQAQVVVRGKLHAKLATYGETRLREYERCLSRFLPDSELTQLNHLAGFPTVISPLLFTFISAAWHAHDQSGGAYDPTMGRMLADLGYDRSFEDLNKCVVGAYPDRPPRSAQNLSRDQVADRVFTIDPTTRMVCLSSEIQLDLGGIAKGLAADLVSAELMELGASGCCVNIGGDLRVRGSGPNEASGWTITLTCPGATQTPTVSLRSGGVCTSSTTKRRWARGESGDETRHHILDPRTGRPSDSGLRSVSVISRSAAAAEVLATTTLVDGYHVGARRIADAGATGLIVKAADQGQPGEILPLPGFTQFSHTAS